MIKLKITRNQTVTSIFQLQIAKIKTSRVFLTSCSFPQTLCPLVFTNAYIQQFYIRDLVNSFLKTNTINFGRNSSFATLNSRILLVNLNRVENIPLDSSFINPFVFEKLREINVYGYVSSVSRDLFDSIIPLKHINFKSVYFRKLVHQTGIDWIQGSNRAVNVDLDNELNVRENINKSVYVTLTCEARLQEEPIKRIFPDEDFCIYVKYPFRQLVFLMQYCENSNLINMIKKLNPDLGCTYVWINRHARHLEKKIDFKNIEKLNLRMITESNLFKNMNR